MHAWTNAAEGLRTHLRAHEISKFSGEGWADAHQMPIGAPIFAFALGLQNPLGGPGQKAS